MIKLFVMDVDGTMTDGKIYMGASGEMMKAFSIKDGHAIGKMLPSYGVKTAIITARDSRIVENRAKELGIDIILQGVKDKRSAALELCTKQGVPVEQTAYVGDDEGDIDLLKAVGFSACPRDAVEKVKEVCDYISEKDGGEGAIRDIVEWLIKNHRIGE